MTPFDQLPFAVQRDVLRLARAAERHPDRDVARAAFSWAEAEMARQRKGWGFLWFVVDMVTGFGGGSAVAS